MVYCQELKSWCRALIKSIVSSADHYLAECFLVDFAKYIPVKSKEYVLIFFSPLLFKETNASFKGEHQFSN